MPFNPLDYPILFDMPSRNVFSAWSQHTPFAMLLVQLMQPKSVVELGAFRGMSYCAFCQAIQTLHLNCQAYAIDTWKGDNHALMYGPDVLQELHDYHDPLYSNFSTLIQSAFDDALTQFSDGSIDILHIDGYHTYDSVKHDFSSWLPKVKSGGVILLHDIIERQQDFGVWKLWDEIKMHFPHTFEFHHGHGLGVVVVGPTVPQQLLPIFQMNANDVIAFRRLCFELGQRVDMDYSRKVSQDELQKLRSAVVPQSEHDDVLQEEVQRLSQLVQANPPPDEYPPFTHPEVTQIVQQLRFLQTSLALSQSQVEYLRQRLQRISTFSPVAGKEKL